MKRILTLLLLLCTLAASATESTEFFDEYKSNPNYTVVYVSPAMIKMLTGNSSTINLNGMKGTIPAIESLISIQVVSTDKKKIKSELKRRAVEVFCTKNGFEVVSLVSDPDEGSIEMLTKRLKDKSWLTVIVTEDKSSASVVIIRATEPLTDFLK